MSAPSAKAGEGSRGGVVVAVECADLRRALDPTAWMVLEELALFAAVAGRPEAAGGAEVLTSVRELAERLGLGKDTVATALRRLAAVSLVCRLDERIGETGRFGRSRYRVQLRRSGLRAEGFPPVRPPSPDTEPSVLPSRALVSSSTPPIDPPDRRRRGAKPAPAAQLSLLDRD